MHAIKQARRFIEEQPDSPDARVLSDLVLALEDDTPLQLGPLYDLKDSRFQLALRILDEWKLDRHLKRGRKLIEASRDAQAEGHEPADAAPPAKDAAKAAKDDAKPGKGEKAEKGEKGGEKADKADKPAKPR